MAPLKTSLTAGLVAFLLAFSADGTNAAPIVDTKSGSAPTLTDAQFANTPFVAKVHHFDKKTNGTTTTACGGALFTRKIAKGGHAVYFVSAAHCFVNEKGEFDATWAKNNRIIVAGEASTQANRHSSPAFPINEIAVGSGGFKAQNAFEAKANGKLGQLIRHPSHDFVVARLSIGNKFAKELVSKLIKFDYRFDAGSAKVGDEFKMISWGSTNEKSIAQPKTAKSTNMKIAKNSVCESHKFKSGGASYKMDDKVEWCLSSTQGFSCFGDGGSILFKQNGKTVTFAGVMLPVSDEVCAATFQRALKISPYVSSTMGPFLKKHGSAL